MEIPENGFYSHYKYDPIKGFKYLYEVTGIGIHSEDQSVFVIYRPLYDIDDLVQPISFVRPLELFTDTVQHNGNTIPHFNKITDPELIANLNEVKNQMYK